MEGDRAVIIRNVHLLGGLGPRGGRGWGWADGHRFTSRGGGKRGQGLPDNRSPGAVRACECVIRAGHGSAMCRGGARGTGVPFVLARIHANSVDRIVGGEHPGVGALGRCKSRGTGPEGGQTEHHVKEPEASS